MSDLVVTPERSYRQAERCHPEAMMAASGYLMSEWGEHGYTIGYAGEWVDSVNKAWSVFQCCASDGARFLIRADRYGNRGHFGVPSLEREVGAALNVETSV
jgi:hypothetical protein